jgi:F-type H+-transporting ATPase subunit b
MTPPNLSLILIMVCFWVTLWVVYRFLIRPVGAVINERRRRIDDARSEWTAKNEEYDAALARVEDELGQAAREAAKIREAARQRAMDERQTTLDAARARADERLAEILETLDQETEAAREDLDRRARQLARLLAGRLLGRELAS